MDALKDLLSSSETFMPHGHCYLWKPGLLWLHVVSDVLIALAYLSIPFTLVYFARKRRNLPFRWLFISFGLFIVACGATHALEVWNVWRADYWLAGGVKALTAAISVATAALLARAVPEALTLPTPGDLQRANEDLARLHRQLQDAYEEAARHSQERYRALVEAATDAVVSAGDSGGIVLFNAAAERIFGYTAQEVYGREAWVLAAPELAERLRGNLARLLATGETEIVGRTVELQARRKNGELFPAELSLSVSKEEGRLVFTGFIRDITDRKRLEQQLLQSQKMEAIGQLAGGVAHDFNNLLSVIGGYSELALKRLGAEDPLRRHLKEIRSAADRAAGLTRQLLAFSRKQALAPEVLDLAHVVTGMVEMLRRLIPENVQVVTAFGPKGGRVRADRGQIEQVILNLAVNARDAMPDGGRLVIETSLEELDEGYCRSHREVRPGPYVLLAVSDTGQGMDAETQSRLFEPFFTTKEVGKGTGLGLATVYGIVKQHEGHIAVYSEPGLGTTFKVYLPRVDEGVAGEEQAAAAAAPRTAPASETVLLVEDADAVRLLNREVLEGLGYRVLEARDGEAAIEASERHPGPLHLLLTDMVMPGMNGRQLAERLTASRPELRVLFVSGYTNDMVVRSSGLEPGMAFLQKPFTPDQLARKVRQVLEAPSKRDD